MEESSDKERSKLSIILWITAAMLAEAVFVLWPLGTVLACTGWLSVSIITFVVHGLIFGLIFGLITGLGGAPDGGVMGVVLGPIFGPIFGLIGGFAGGPVVAPIVGPIAGLAYGLIGGIIGRIVTLDGDSIDSIAFGLFFAFFFGFSGGLAFDFSGGLAFDFSGSLAFDFSGNRIFRLDTVLDTVLGVVAGVLFGMSLCSGFRKLGKGGIEAVKQFFIPWRSGRLYFGRSVGFFITLYMFFVLLFSLWFYASYLSATKVLPTMNEYFETQDIVATSNFWTFTYFSFITIASLGYGDIYPTHWSSQILVILETMTGVGLIAGFLTLIISVGGRGKRRIREIDFDSDIDY